MKRLLFFICCSLISVQIFAQTEISKELFPTLAGLQRTSFHDWGEDCKTSYSTLTAPTETVIINNKQYLRFNYSTFGDVFLREEDEKVLIYSSFYDKDLVLYDWTLEIGDSLSYLAVDEYLSKSSEYPVIVDYRLTKSSADENGNTIVEKQKIGKIAVKKISTITLLDGKEYKMWEFDEYMVYVEGIGTFGNDVFAGNYFYLIQPEYIATCYFGEFFVCASRNGELLYQIDKEEQQKFGSACKCLSAGAESENPETNIEIVTTPNTSLKKVIHNGQLLIIKDGKTYNLMGVEVQSVLEK